MPISREPPSPLPSRDWRGGLASERQSAALSATKGYAQVGKTKDVREAVEAELTFDPLVDPANITVKNMNGEVALNGTVPSYPQYLEAADGAQRVAGVKNVHNHLEVVLPPGDYRDDAMLTTAANNALTLNVTIPDSLPAAVGDMGGPGGLPAHGRRRAGRHPHRLVRPRPFADRRHRHRRHVHRLPADREPRAEPDDHEPHGERQPAARAGVRPGRDVGRQLARRFLRQLRGGFAFHPGRRRPADSRQGTVAGHRPRRATRRRTNGRRLPASIRRQQRASLQEAPGLRGHQQEAAHNS